MLRAELIRPLHELLRSNALRFGDKVAFQDARRSVSHAELERRTARLAGGLAGLRLQPGDRAAILLGNRVETVEGYLAIVRAAAIGVPVDPRLTDSELSHILEDSGARVVITEGSQVERLRTLPGAADRRIVVVGDAPPPPGTVAHERLASTTPAAPARDDLPLDAPAWMLYTSGTTGRPKGVLSSQRSCLWSVAACYAPIPGLSPDDRVLWPLPLFHSLSHIACVLGVTAVGATAHILDGFAADVVRDALREHSITFLAGVPTIYHHLVRAAREERFEAPDLRVCLVGGAVTTAALRRSFEEAFGAPLLDAYGSTETCGAITINWPTGARVEGSCGLPVPGLGVRLVDPDSGADVGPGAEGEVWVRGPSVMLGYHDRPDATAEAFRDGWYRTGDLARRDEDGYFTITGRIKELIIRGGENIHPGEVEEVLRGVPGVADAAVAGRPHEILGEVPVAHLVAGPEGFDPDEVLAACRERLSAVKVPEELYEVEEIPRTASGKITRHVLLERPGRLRAVGAARHDSLFRLDWSPAPVPGSWSEETLWAVPGPDPFGLAEHLRARGATVASTDRPQVTVLSGGADVPLRELVDRVRAHLEDGAAEAGTLAVVTRGAVAAAPGDDVPDLAGAAAWGAVRSLQAAHPGRVVLVDLDSEGAAALPEAILSGEPRSALRSGAVLRPRLVRVASGSTSRTPMLPDTPHTVVVTGADGPIGARAARHLATAHGARRILLVSERGETDPAATALRAELAGRGVEATLTACDIADGDASAALLADLPADLAAVVIAPGTSTRAPRTARTGALNLHELTTDLNLSAFVLLSPITTPPPAPAAPTAPPESPRSPASPTSAPVPAPAAPPESPRSPASSLSDASPRSAGPVVSVGSSGFVAADVFGREDEGAEAFFVALAHHRVARGLPALALSLDGRLSEAEGAVMFDAAHMAGHPALTGLTPGADEGVPVRGAAPDDAASARLRERLDGLSGDAQERLLTDLVRAEVAELYDAPDGDGVPADLAFRDLGLTSATAVELRARLIGRTGLRLPVTLAFDHPTPAAVARRLRALLVGGEAHTSALVGEPAPNRSEEPIAVVAMACRLPGGVADPDGLWRLVRDGRDAIGPFPEDRGWDLDGLYDPDPGRAGRSYVRAGGFLYNAGDFDADLFGISPREGLAMDPQQRLLLETSWEAVERAGIDPASLRGSDAGVFTGVMYHDYATELGEVPDGLEGYLGTGNAGSVASGRVAYTLGLEGPAVTVDTACSSSLVALHLAVRALRDGECTLALAGGVAVMAKPTSFIEFSRQRALAPDGRCKPFADAADGTAWSEGVGVLVLERLSDARRAGREVLAVVRGSAVNQDGASNGLTAPSGPAQERVIRRALADAGLSAADVDAVEAHGTGTTLGDPIEAQALLATYGQDRPADRPLLLGSLKSNIGHAQAAAGVAGVIKTVLALRHGELPRILHLDEPSSRVDWSSGAVEPLTESRPWPETDRPRRAAVSSFGVSGTNAHVILEEAPEPRPEATGDDAVLDPAAVPLVLSARSPEALRAQAARLASSLADRPGHGVTDEAFSLLTTRAALDHRAVVVAAERDRAVAALRAFAAGGPVPDVVAGSVDAAAGRTVLVFPGQGAQWVGMGAALLESSSVFASRLGECAAVLDGLVEWSLLDVVRDGGPLDRVDVVQPVSWAVMVSLAAVWESLGLTPDAVVGHSQGEIAAACVAGALSLEDAARVVVRRSQVIASRLAGGGGMVSVALPEDRVAARLVPGVEIAVVNGPSSVVIAGAPEALDDVVAGCEADGVRVRRIAVDYASHSRQVAAVRDELSRELAGIRPQPGRVPFYSTTDGAWLRGDALDAEYWYRNLRRPVRFGAAVEALAEQSHRVFVECSSHPVLTSGVQEILDGVGGVVVGTLRRDDGDLDRVYASAAELWTAGVPVDWAAAFEGTGARRVPLPTYAFQRKRYWLRPSRAGHPLIDTIVELSDTGGVVLTGGLHDTVDPTAALLDLVLLAGDEIGRDVIHRLVVEEPPNGDARIQVIVAGEPDADGRHEVAVHARNGSDPWKRHAHGLLETGGGTTPDTDLGAWPPPGAVVADTDDAAWTRDGDLFAEVALDEEQAAQADRFALHPALLGAALRVVGRGRAPVAFERVELHATGATALRVAADENLALTLTDPSGRPVASIGAVETVAPTAGTSAPLYAIEWMPFSAPAAPGRRDAVVSRLAPSSGEGDDARRLREATTAVLETVQRWLAGTTDSRLIVVTHGAVAVGDPDEVRDLGAAAAWGLLRSAQAEHPGRLTIVDVEHPDDPLPQAAVLSDEPQLAVRDGRLHIPRLVTVAADAEERPGLDPDGTVLITGGTGTLGARVARRLVTHHGVRRLLLCSRRGANAPGAADLVRDLAGLGADVTVAACDVGDRAALAALLATVPADHPLTGVVHTAGALDDGVITALTPERLAAVHGPKADAALALHELTADAAPAFFVLFSSAAGVLGNAGQGNYAAANAFLDGLAHRRRAAGLPGVSLAWGWWDETSELTARLDETAAARHRRQGVVPMSTETGLDLFDAALRSGRPALVPVALDLPGLRDRSVSEPVPPLLRGLVRAKRKRRAALAPTAGAHGGGLAERLARSTEAERTRLLVDLVRREAAAVLGHAGPDAVPPHRAFKETGFDSLTAVELRNRLNAATGRRLSATLVFDHPTPASLAEHLRGALAGDRTETAVATAPRHVREDAGDDDPIAIVAVGCRYPGGVEDPDGFWRLVRDGVDAITDLPEDRGWDLDAFDDDPDRPGTYYVRKGSFVDAAGFDAEFFGISPWEAIAMDPQQRLLLEVTWELIERAGIDPGSLRESDVGVFTGLIHHDYTKLLSPPPPELEGYRLTGTAGSVASGRIAYTLGLRGPAITVDTACSSSLVALHLATRALRNGECAMAIVGGATVMSTMDNYIDFSRQRGLAPDGRAKAFAAAADGTAWSEGAGLLLLERLSDARRAGREVLAVIRGTAVNQDGASNGLTAPNGPAQRQVIANALADAGLSSADVDAVEGHGTGTTLGDPIEAQALLATYGRGRPADRPLWLGSIKSNIGHSQAAGGVAGVIKMVLAMRHRVLPPTLHVDAPSPEVDWSTGEVRLLTEARPWEPDGDRPRRAGVSAFGVSGTNAHVILEEAPPSESAEPEPSAEPPVLPLVVSAGSAGGLRGQAGRLAAHLAAAPPVDTAFSLVSTRAQLTHRAVLVGRSRAELLAGLAALRDDRSTPALVNGVAGHRADGESVLVFPGQGAQWVGMGAALLESSSVFAARLGECAAVLDTLVEWSLLDVVRDGGPLDRVDVVQPVSWAVMVSLAAVWESLGVAPDAVVGHSQGEIAAACVAGALSLEDAARVVVRRSQVIAARLSGRGTMASVALPEDRVAARLVPGVEIAVVNGPSSVVVAGAPEALDEVIASCEADGVRVRRIAVDYASHSAYVESIRDELVEALADIHPRPPKVPFFSTVDGTWVEDASLDAEYWYRNLRRPVHFEAAIKALAEQGHRVFVESSSHPVLTSSVQEILDDAGAVVAGTLRRDDGDLDRVYLSAAELWTAGVPIDWSAVFQGTGARRIPLPTYAFQHRRFWPDVTLPTTTNGVSAPSAAGTEKPLAERLAGLPEEDRLPTLLDLVRDAAAAALGETEPSLAPDAAFFDVGFNSLRATELRNRLVGRTGLKLPATLIFDHVTPRMLAEHLLDELTTEGTN
ncbi:type I polyketide synthase [Thermomonospora umbrina]|uniref:Acyl transferase domain-containing protein n=1 Tax=Thermomonospora umbrina TaxID=111806 RepID=A0A3D9SFW3_9ACTN|nr:type I polyketide synthase [Thermomonospora umbrina]REE94796.1 acyl transferase domain-containing protein [Thermomonospora umbrina]